MISTNKEKLLFQYLINRSLDRKLTEEEFLQFNDLILKHEDLESYYVDCLQLQFALRQTHISDELEFNEEPVLSEAFWLDTAKYENEAPAIEILKEEPQRELIQKVVYPPREKHKMSKCGIVAFIAGAAAALFLIIFVKFAPVRPGSVDVATLVDQINVQWAHSSNKLENGDRLWTGDGVRNLQKGIVKIQYDDGVDVLVEGPALFEVERHGLYMEYGRLYSHVSETGIGFTVKSPSSLFIDQGTEFGIQADVNGSSELHVIKGKVQVFAGGKDQSKSDQMVTQGNAVRYDANRGSVESIPVQKEVFARTINSKLGVVWRGQRHGPGLIAYEGFDYGTQQDLVGLTGGIGWTGAWEKQTEGDKGTYTVVSALENTSVSQSGNALSLTVDEAANREVCIIRRQLQTKIGLAKGTVWGSAVIQGLQIGDGHFFINIGEHNGESAVGKCFGESFAIDNTATKIKMDTKKPYLIVWRYDFYGEKAPLCDTYLWIDPDTSKVPDIKTADASRAGDYWLPSETVFLNLQLGIAPQHYVIDEFCLGASFWDILPLNKFE